MTEPRNIKHEQIEKAFFEILDSLSVKREISTPVVEGLIQTSLRGVDSHGIRLFPHYIKALKAGRLNRDPKFNFTQTSDSVGKLDADHTFGHTAGVFAVEKAIELAKISGLGAVAVFNSSHFGAAAYYGLKAAERDMIGISMTHADALMLSSNGKRAFFGTNPICVTAPVEGEEPFCLDMATTNFTWNKIKMYRESNMTLPEGIAADENGQMTTDPKEAVSLFPIGDFKGFGLGMVVDMFCSLLSGMPFGREITDMYRSPIEEKRFLGQFYMAINIEKFVNSGDFKKRLKKYMAEIRNEPSKEANLKVMVPGDPEKEAFSLRKDQGIPMTETEYQALLALCEECKVAVP